MRALEVQEVRVSGTGEDKKFLTTHKGRHSAGDWVLFKELVGLRIALQDHWLPERSKFGILRHYYPLNPALYRDLCHQFHIQTHDLVLPIFCIE